MWKKTLYLFEIKKNENNYKKYRSIIYPQIKNKQTKNMFSATFTPATKTSMCCLFPCAANPYSNLLKYWAIKSDLLFQFHKTWLIVVSFHTIHKYNKNLHLFHRFKDFFVMRTAHFLNLFLSKLIGDVCKILCNKIIFF